MGLDKFKTDISTEDNKVYFKESLRIGKTIEQIVLGIIQRKYPKAYIIDGKFKDYDILVPENNSKIEVKSDQKSKHTDQFVIEVEMNGKPSGITSTTADYWILYDGTYFYWVKPGDLCKTILRAGLKQAEFKGGTDTKFKKAYFVPVSTIKSISTLIHQIR